VNPSELPDYDETPAERDARLKDCLEKMEIASRTFYHMAIRIGNHTFIEFTGLMNEYIKVCREHYEKGIDFTKLSAHGGMTLKLQAHEIAYLQEKLTCIYGEQWRNQAVRR
jgi:hypothetical protein